MSPFVPRQPVPPERSPVIATSPVAASPSGRALRIVGWLAARVGLRSRPGSGPEAGEVVWTWVAYEENPRRGKDRPVLVLGRRRGRLLALMLSTTDHDGAMQVARGRHWMEIGSGGWDRRRRPSEVRLDRLLRLDPSAVRRDGAALDRDLFRRVRAAARTHQRLR